MLTDRKVFWHQVLCRQQCQIVHALLCTRHQIHLDRLPASLLIRRAVSAAFLPENTTFADDQLVEQYKLIKKNKNINSALVQQPHYNVVLQLLLL